MARCHEREMDFSDISVKIDGQSLPAISTVAAVYTNKTLYHQAAIGPTAVGSPSLRVKARSMVSWATVIQTAAHCSAIRCVSMPSNVVQVSKLLVSAATYAESTGRSASSLICRNLRKLACKTNDAADWHTSDGG